MEHRFDPGYAAEPFATLCRDYPGPEVYPPGDFRVEWGPIFHRGRLDGSARLLVLGQDPSAHESIARRILVGEAGQRVQGFLAKLGIVSSYVMVNAFLYSVYGQQSGERYAADTAIAAYRDRWLDALLDGTGVEAVVAFGHLADRAFRMWRATPSGQRYDGAYATVTHPTYPESTSHRDEAKHDQAIAAMLQDWNRALERLSGRIRRPDQVVPLVPYGQRFALGERLPIPEGDLPAGLPSWMGALDNWADRTGPTPDEKRASILVSVPRSARTWQS